MDVANPPPTPPNAHTATPISALRRAMVYALLGVLVIGHIYVVARKLEVWPFSHYPMYSTVFDASWRTYAFVAVLADEAETEVTIPLRLIPREVSVRTSLRRVHDEVELGLRPSEDIDEVLHWAAMLYLRHREEEGFPLEPLAAMRLYRNVWTLNRSEGKVAIEHHLQRDLQHQTSMEQDAL